MTAVRVRFAPSPTGELHIGGAHTALFNWLFARNNSGSLVLRLEDTDKARSQQKYVTGIIDSLRWLGIDWDEGPDSNGPWGPYSQSERVGIYHQYIRQLLDEGRAYYCFCSETDLLKEKEAAREDKQGYYYSGHCRDLGSAEVQTRLAAGQMPVVRIKSPTTGITTVNDLIRGPVNFENDLFDDFIIVKADGWPTYNLAVVIDDHTMQISHVIRAEEHLSNTPKQLILYQALDFKMPQFAHVSMILAPDRKKLSKRHGATPIRELCEQGYLPEAVISYLAQLGTSGNDEILLTKEEMINNFALDKISRSPAVYDMDKLTWLNSQILSQLTSDRIMSDLADHPQVQSWMARNGTTYWLQVIDLLKSRARTLVDLVAMADYFFDSDFDYDAQGVSKYFKVPNTAAVLLQLLQSVESVDLFSAAILETKMRALAETLDLKAARLIHPARLALTGRTATPGLFEIMELLGREECVLRLKRAIIFIDSLEND